MWMPSKDIAWTSHAHSRHHSPWADAEAWATRDMLAEAAKAQSRKNFDSTQKFRGFNFKETRDTIQALEDQVKEGEQVHRELELQNFRLQEELKLTKAKLASSRNLTNITANLRANIGLPKMICGCT